MYKSKFTLSDDTEEFEGYTDGSLWNGWANVLFTKEQMEAFLNSTPYDYHFTELGVVVHWDDKEELFYSSPIPTDSGDILLGYALDGYEFMEQELPE
jgi:hypothetical protein